jgi:hypothetical protein
MFMYQLPDARIVMEQLPLWFEDYNNEYHPHKELIDEGSEKAHEIGK